MNCRAGNFLPLSRGKKNRLGDDLSSRERHEKNSHAGHKQKGRTSRPALSDSILG
jgi:hypothetical protein